MDVECKYKLKNNTCDLANQLAGKDIVPHQTACDFCTNKTDPPQSINRVTVSIAISGLKDDKKKSKELINTYGHLLKQYVPSNDNIRLKAILSGYGVGSQMWKLLEKIGIEHSDNCGCLTWAERMNSWGPEGCRLAHKEIVEHMKSSAKGYGWKDLTIAVAKSIKIGLAFKINPLDIYGSLLDEAIRLAEIEERKIPLEDGALN